MAEGFSVPLNVQVAKLQDGSLPEESGLGLRLHRGGSKRGIHVEDNELRSHRGHTTARQPILDLEFGYCAPRRINQLDRTGLK